jgi:alpha-galactosidase
MLPEYQVWSKPLSATETAVLVVNNAVFDTAVSFTLAELGLPATVFARDMWTHTSNGSIDGSYAATIPSHGGIFLKLTV